MRSCCCRTASKTNPAGPERGARRRRHGFTLVELLVVIGIIALLISILLPTLNRAREAGKSVQCLSNLRQLSQATIMFATENKGWMPGRAGGSVTIINSAKDGYVIKNANATEAAENTSWDWVAWQRQVDPATGQTTTGKNANQNITLSGLAKFMGVKPITGVAGAQANQVAEKVESVFRCPSDNIASRPKMNPAETGYRYSYSINDNVATRDSGNGVGVQSWGGGPPGFTAPGTARSWGRFNGKMSSIKKPSEIILFVCEDEMTLDDGLFSPRPYNWGGGTINAVAARHQARKATAKGGGSTMMANMANEDARGNVSFCDGHAEVISRLDALRQRHSGNPYPDPGVWPFAR